MQIETLLVESLIPYARNARTHSDAQVAQIAGSIREFGFTNPVLIDAEGGIIAGHGRVLAARKLGMREVPYGSLATWEPSIENKQIYRPDLVLIPRHPASDYETDETLQDIVCNAVAQMRARNYARDVFGQTLPRIDA